MMLLAGYACAKIASPYGGPKDEAPPEIVNAKPPENSVNFVPEKRIILVFDEYIQLKDIFQELIISPPLEEKISARLRGKSIIIEFPPETVFDSTTYTISFGNAIVDNNEGNVLENYQYVFSLNDYLDTMNVEGWIVDAFNHQPDEDRMLVMLYKNLNDSAPITEQPAYITRSNKEGNFRISNISTGEYRIFGLKDANLNNLYDLPNENVAFGDSVIELSAEKFLEDVVIRDSVLYDSLVRAEQTGLSDSAEIHTLTVTQGPANDTTGQDSVIYEKTYSYHTELFFFAKKVYTQYLRDYQRPRPELFSFIFNEAMLDTFELFPLNITPAVEDWFLLEASSDCDSLNFWLTDSLLYKSDSLQVELCYPLSDSSGQVYMQADTLWMISLDEQGGKDKKLKRPSRDEDAGKEKDKPKVLTMSNNFSRGGGFDLNKDIALISITPIQDFIADSMHLYRLKDTLQYPVPHQVFKDTASIYKIRIDFTPEEETTYRFFCKDSIITDIYGISNDTIEYKFTTKALSAYSALNINISNVHSELILQLMNDKEEVLAERARAEDGAERFEYLSAGKYKLKITVDSNRNGVWDTGDYLKKIQPENVLYFDQVIELRTNWEMEFNWELNY